MKILYFLSGSMATPEEQAEADLLGTKMFRNSSLVQDSDKPEECDAVAGKVPPSYSKFPLAKPRPVVVETVKPQVPAAPASDPKPLGAKPAEQVTTPPPTPPPAASTSTPWAKPAEVVGISGTVSGSSS